MTFLWHFNIVLRKILEFDPPITEKGITNYDLKVFTSQYAPLSQCDTDQIVKMGISLGFLIKPIKENNILITELGETFLNYQNPMDDAILTKNQKDLVKNIILKNEVIEDLKKFIYKRGENYLVYRFHRDQTCMTLIGMLKNVSLLEDRGDEYFLFLLEHYNEHWNRMFKALSSEEEFHYLINDYNDYWNKIFRGEKFTEEDLEKKLEEQKILGNKGEEIALKKELELVSKYSNKSLTKKVKLVARDYVALGYDIISVYQDGSSKYIEVKTTSTKNSRFFISRHEFKVSKKYIESYWIYYVDLSSNIIRMFNNIPNLVEKKKILLEPSLFEAKLIFDKIEYIEIDLNPDDLLNDEEADL